MIEQAKRNKQKETPDVVSRNRARHPVAYVLLCLLFCALTIMMVTSTAWIKEGAQVGLRISNRHVGNDLVISLDPSWLCHNSPLGADNVLVLLQEVFNQTVRWGDSELLKELIGGFLVWERNQIFQVRLESHVGGHLTDHGEPPKYSKGRNSTSHGEDPMELAMEVILPKALWMGMPIKVVDETLLQHYPFLREV